MPEKMDRGPEPLSGEIEIRPAADPAEGKWIHVGNTGLSFNIFETDRRTSFTLHFAPEGAHEPDPQNRLKYASIFGFAILKLLRWSETPDAKKVLDAEPHTVIGYTNSAMREFVEHLFGKAAHMPAGKYDPDMILVELDFDAMRNDPAVMDRLEKLSRRAEAQDYTMTD
jgi:hypothetical protein